MLVSRELQAPAELRRRAALAQLTAASWPVPEWARCSPIAGLPGRWRRARALRWRSQPMFPRLMRASRALRRRSPRVPFAPSLERSTRTRTQMETLAARRQYRPEPGYPRQAWGQMWRLAHRAVPPLALPARWVAALQRWSAARTPRGPCPQRPARRVAASSQRRLRPAVRRAHSPALLERTAENRMSRFRVARPRPR